MDSQITKAKDYVVINQHCIAEIIALPESGKFRIYVAWEWKDMADKKVFGFAKSRELHETVTEKNIDETMRRGWDIGGTDQVKKIFKNIL